MTYTAIYVSPKTGDKITVHSLSEPPKTRAFNVAGGRRKYIRRKCIRSNRKVIIVAKAKTKKKKDVEEELDELEELEELDEMDEDEDEEDDDSDEPEDEADEDDDEDEDDDDEDDEDEEEEAPKSKKKSKSKPSRSRTTDGKVGTSEIAQAAGVDARTLRMVLRKHQIEKDEETGRYEWSSMNHKTVKKILRLLKEGEGDNVKKESLDKLKSGKSGTSKTKKKAKDSSKKKSKKSKKKS